jgi:sigma-E factor negative regulatory protein RseA
MSEQQRQHVSAFVDGEVDPALVHATLSALESSGDLRAAWESYHLISGALRSEPVREEYRELALRVSERIAVDPVPLMTVAARREWPSRLGPFAGAALAASAAFFVVFAVPHLFKPSLDSPPPANRQVASASSTPVQFRLPALTQRWHVDKPALEDKLDRFLVNHQERSPVSGMKGFLPYATVVGYVGGR